MIQPSDLAGHRWFTGCTPRRGITAALGALCVLFAPWTWAGGGPLGIDHEWRYDNHGMWNSHNEIVLQDGVLAVELGGALWLGNNDDFGHTLWQSVDSTALAAVSSVILKYGLSRRRPDQGNDPNRWLQGSCCDSFPSGQVTIQASFVTPLILRYAHDTRWIWALEALPAFDGLLRLKHQEHWQSDVLAGWALGTATGYWAARRETPLSVQLLPRGLTIGLQHQF